MKKFVVVGSTGAGKSTFARALSKKLNISHIELDNISRIPGGKSRSTQELRDLVIKATVTPQWIVCGNYPALKDIILDRADVIVWLDYPFFICFWQTLKRSFKHIIKREKYSNGDRETFVRLFFSKDSILVYLIKTFRQRNKRYAAMMQDPFYKDKTFIRLKSHRQAKKCLWQIDI